MATTANWFRQNYWIDGLYEDDRGYYRFDRPIDAETFSAAISTLGRNKGPALLLDLHYGRTLDLKAYPGVVAEAWSSAEYPERALIPRNIWVHLFRTAGYTHDGKPAIPPAETLTLYRGCTSPGRRRMAWTSDFEVARRFAHHQIRGRAHGHVYAIDAPPDTLLAFIHETGREENEYVIDSRFLKDAAVRLVEK
ncbi:hypothetical protein [Mycobacterium kubicae]|uniref:hypothetical protein n=1 Tax=Mycobacterium kubicae TaxID=120959 RepID=UPI001041ECB4|nr:hypothetical protein [Mycobacterium kubicae]